MDILDRLVQHPVIFTLQYIYIGHIEWMDNKQLYLETTHKKTKRVRSWYLYEQFKSLERNQLDAAQKLKDRSYQERILRQELRERRARRKIYDQFGLCTSDSLTEKSSQSEGTRTTLNVSNDEFFESFCELDENERLSQITGNDIGDPEDIFSQDESLIGKSYVEEFKSIDDIRNDNSCAESMNSVVENDNTENLADDIKEELKSVKKNIAENISIELEKVKENLQYLDNYNKLYDENKTSAVKCLNFTETPKSNNVRERVCRVDNDNNLYIMWSKLVSFAYQVIRLNHGNCYYDYSSQFLTAVLACDVLRRGINRMCHILQPYVSPIKYATDESETSSVSQRSVKRRTPRFTKKSSNSKDDKLQSYRIKDKKIAHNKKFNSEYTMKPTLEYENYHKRRASEPWRSTAKFSTIKKDTSHSSTTIWPDFSREYLTVDCDCSCHTLKNPMLKIAHYIDSLLKEIDDSNSE
ncbi:uncharacterized protein ACR2FA_001313 [Aphomia sociella]